MKKHISPTYYKKSRMMLLDIKENLDKQVVLIERMQGFLRKWVEEKEKIDLKNDCKS